jgi:hypothetical protein
MLLETRQRTVTELNVPPLQISLDLPGLTADLHVRARAFNNMQARLKRLMHDRISSS